MFAPRDYVRSNFTIASLLATRLRPFWIYIGVTSRMRYCVTSGNAITSVRNIYWGHFQRNRLCHFRFHNCITSAHPIMSLPATHLHDCVISGAIRSRFISLLFLGSLRVNMVNLSHFRPHNDMSSNFAIASFQAQSASLLFLCSLS